MGREAGDRSPAPLLTPDVLSARRAASRRRRRRRRQAAAAGVLISAAVVAAAIALATGTGGSPARPVRSSAPQSAIATTVFAHLRSRLMMPLWPFGDRPRTRTRTRRHAAASVSSVAAVDRVLAYTSYVQLAGHRKREIALTFDDGPGIYTPRILSVLKRLHAPATFFVIGREAEAFPRFVRLEARAGDAVGDHTELHPPLAQLSPAAQRSEIVTAALAIRRAGAPEPILFRPPYGSFDAATMSILDGVRMLMVLWSVDTSDYARPGVSRIVDTAVSGRSRARSS